MADFFLSFGQTHAHAIPGHPTFDKDTICVITAESNEAARKIAFDTFGAKWCFIYEEKPDMSFFPRGLIKLKK